MHISQFEDLDTFISDRSQKLALVMLIPVSSAAPIATEF
jgi:hypothetical protein